MINKHKTLIMLTLSLAAVLVVGFRAISISNKTSAQPECASPNKTVHTVNIVDGKAMPADVQAHLCDTLTIVNDDHEPREMAFGLHEAHEPYNGVTERFLNPHQSFSVVLNQTGTYRFHDHLDDSSQGYFHVSN